MEEITWLNNDMINLSKTNNSSTKSQKEAFLFYLKRMDIEMINLILDDKYSYFDVTKDIFINKLYSFKSELEALGEIDSIQIFQKDNTSNTYFLCLENYDLQQELTFIELENNIVDINSIFNSELHKWSPLELNFGLDERINFKPSVEYLIQVNHCTIALEEMVNKNIKILDHDTIEYWINKHNSLYEQIKDELLMFKFNDFRKLFELLKDLKALLECSFATKYALMNFDGSNDTSIKKWINDSITLYVSHVEFFEGYFIDFEKVTYLDANETIQLDLYPNIYLLRNDFIDVKKFHDLFLEHSNFSSLEINDDDLQF
jgi:hypothetical protein